jgi:hypothetical protein
MTKKHFVAMAALIRQAKRDAMPAEYVRGLYRMAIYLGTQFGARFDCDRFRAACEPR